MITLFTGLCKTALKKISGEKIFQEESKEYNYYDKSCPGCGANGKLTPYGAYSRNLIDYTDGSLVESRVEPRRFKCGSCQATHALLPHIVNPYSPYCLRFKLEVLITYYERESTVLQISERFGIAVSTLYEWKKLLLDHQELLIILFVEQKKPALEFLQGLLESERLSDCLCEFFRRYAFPFLKKPTDAATQSVPP